MQAADEGLTGSGASSSGLWPSRCVNAASRILDRHKLSTSVLLRLPSFARLLPIENRPQPGLRGRPAKERKSWRRKGDNAMGGAKENSETVATVHGSPDISLLRQDHFSRLVQLARSLSGDLIQSATAIAEGFTRERSFITLAVASQLSELMLSVADADVAFVRILRRDEILELFTVPTWAGGPERAVGTIPERKHCQDGPCDWKRTSGGDRKPEFNQSAQSRGIYHANEMQFLQWLRSEAWIPIRIGEATKAVVCLGKGVSGHFSDSRLNQLRPFEDFIKAFYHLAELTEDRILKSGLLRNVAAVLPQITAASYIEGFWRAVCTLLTCNHGFRFDRAMLFWMNNRGYPAECKMAVGGTASAWARERESINEHFSDLHDYILDSLHQPVPGKGKCNLADPLFEAIRVHPLRFEEVDQGRVRSLVESTAPEGMAVKLTNQDPWVAKLKRERPDIFISPHDEYFLFPLTPLGDNRGHDLLGFVIADLAYQPQPHIPGPNVPDLEMVALVLNLLSGMWLSREDTESYLFLLPALPILRHNGWHLSSKVLALDTRIRRRASWQDIDTALKEVIAETKEIENAVEIVDGKRRDPKEMVENLRSTLGAHCRDVERGRSEISVVCGCGQIDHEDGVAISSHFLGSILDCLVDNAIYSAKDDGRNKVTVTIAVQVVQVPESKSAIGSRAVITVANDGPSIPENLVPFLFVDRVSTHEHGGIHRGTGLSTARLLAKAYGGDVVLLSRDPVKFGLVLRIISK